MKETKNSIFDKLKSLIYFIFKKLKNLICCILDKEIVKFGLVGVSNTLVDAGVYWLFISVLFIDYGIAQIVGYTCGIINSFVLNRIWTFKKTSTNKKTRSQLVRFVTINLISLSITLVALKWLVDHMGIDKMVAKLLVIVLSQVVNFLGYKLWVFKGTEKQKNIKTNE